jgi:hypothetical protein
VRSPDDIKGLFEGSGSPLRRGEAPSGMMTSTDQTEPLEGLLRARTAVLRCDLKIMLPAGLSILENPVKHSIITHTAPISGSAAWT